jgi:hypothetical protein
MICCGVDWTVDGEIAVVAVDSRFVANVFDIAKPLQSQQVLGQVQGCEAEKRATGQSDPAGFRGRLRGDRPMQPEERRCAKCRCARKKPAAVNSVEPRRAHFASSACGTQVDAELLRGSATRSQEPTDRYSCFSGRCDAIRDSRRRRHETDYALSAYMELTDSPNGRESARIGPPNPSPLRPPWGVRRSTCEVRGVGADAQAVSSHCAPSACQ